MISLGFLMKMLLYVVDVVTFMIFYAWLAIALYLFQNYIPLVLCVFL